MAFASQVLGLPGQRPGPLGGLGLGQPSPGPVQVGEQVPGLGQAQAVAEALEGGDGQLDLVAALPEELPGSWTAVMPSRPMVACRARPSLPTAGRPGQLLVGPGGLGELAVALLGLGQRRQGGQPRVVGRQQPGRPAQPGLDQPGVAADGGPLPGGGVALAGPPGQLGPLAGRVQPPWRTGRPRRSGGRRSRRTGCAGPRSPAPASRRSARAARPGGRRAAARRRRS